VEKVDSQSTLLKDLGVRSFNERFPWIGGDLQTLRDTFIKEKLPLVDSEAIHIPVPDLPGKSSTAGHLLAFLERPKPISSIRGMVLILHGLGGSSRRMGLRRMSSSLIEAGFVVLKLNLRGADPGRELAAGTYSAKCNTDLIPAIFTARKICNALAHEIEGTQTHIPLYGVGISLGGTILLNGCLDNECLSFLDIPILDGLACISSPLDLSSCSSSIERPRNFVYQNWLLNRLVRQTLSDPFGVDDKEKKSLLGSNGQRSNDMNSIRAFDSAITAPRWGYKDVEAYYSGASPMKRLFKTVNDFQSTLFIQSLDDPWVPAEDAASLACEMSLTKNTNMIDFVFTQKGGHNGFHSPDGCWGDDLVVRWLVNLSNKSIQN
tara:strand:+ start:508 stop:1638 length:1131 start_codon:yes stop_codon:yes gene_type:complete